jgi:hypothetical protein
MYEQKKNILKFWPQGHFSSCHLSSVKDTKETKLTKHAKEDKNGNGHGQNVVQEPDNRTSDYP